MKTVDRRQTNLPPGRGRALLKSESPLALPQTQGRVRRPGLTFLPSLRSHGLHSTRQSPKTTRVVPCGRTPAGVAAARAPGRTSDP